MKSALFSRLEENFRPVWPFWQLWRSQMRFGDNVLLMTWKEGFVQFLWKAHCFPFLERIWGQCDDFENFDANKFDLAKTCCAWPEKSVLYNFHGKRTVFPFWREFQASVTTLTTLTLKNAIWPKRAAHDLKRAFCTIFMKSALRFRFEEKCNKCNDFEKFDPQKYDWGKTSCAWPKPSVLYNFYEKRTVFPFWREFQASVTILRTLTLQNAIWPKRAPHDLKRAFCTIFMKSALFSLFGENLRPVWRFWQLWRSQTRFGLNVLRMTWNERFVKFSWKAQCFPFLKRISGQCDDFDNFDAHKCDLAKTCCAWPENEAFVQFWWKAHCFPVLKRISGQCDHIENFDAHKRELAKTCCAWPEKSVLYNFHGKRTVWPFWREFEASVTNWQLWCSKIRFGKTCWELENFDGNKFDLAKACCAWPEKSVLYNFHGKRTVFPFWREFQASVTTLTTLTLKNAIWPKRAAHDLKRAFCTIFMKSALCFHFEENLKQV